MHTSNALPRAHFTCTIYSRDFPRASNVIYNEPAALLAAMITPQILLSTRTAKPKPSRHKLFTSHTKLNPRNHDEQFPLFKSPIISNLYNSNTYESLPTIFHSSERERRKKGSAAAAGRQTPATPGIFSSAEGYKKT